MMKPSILPHPPNSRAVSWSALAVLLSLTAALAACDGADSPNPMAPLAEPLPSVTRPNISGDFWQTKASIPAPTALARAGGLDNVIYFVGGRDSSGTISTVRAYTLATNMWSFRASLPGHRALANGVSAINGRLYVSGGISNSNGPARTLYVYNPTTNAWTKKANMPAKGACGAQGVIHGRLYVYVPGGSEEGIGNCGTRGFYRYDPSSDKWVARALPASRHLGAVAGVIGGKFYLAGGIAAGGGADQAVHAYNSVTNTWTARASLPSSQMFAAGGALEGKLYVVGGVNGVVTATARSYDPASNAWTTKAPLPTARVLAAGTNAGGQLWVLSGYTFGGFTTKVEAYVPVP